MKFPHYAEYKPSGVEWLGHVPDHWQVQRLKTAATYRVSSVDKVPSETETPVRLCNYTDVYYNERIRADMQFMESTATQDEIERFRLQLDDVLITKDSEDWTDIAIPALVEETADDLVCGYHLAVVRPNNQTLDGPFLFRAFQASAVNQQFQLASSGVTRYGLPKSAIGEALLALPPLDEQYAIAAFLDAETATLDALIEKKRALIELLKEQRSALISRTVTQGLPPNAARASGLDPYPQMKDSGVEWLGEIPKHWELLPFTKYVAEQSDYRGRTPEKVPDGVLLVTARNIKMGYIDYDCSQEFIDREEYQDVMRRGIPREGDILFTTEAPLGNVALVDQEGIALAQRVIRFRMSRRFVHPLDLLPEN